MLTLAIPFQKFNGIRGLGAILGFCLALANSGQAHGAPTRDQGVWEYRFVVSDNSVQIFCCRSNSSCSLSGLGPKSGILRENINTGEVVLIKPDHHTKDPTTLISGSPI